MENAATNMGQDDRFLGGLGNRLFLFGGIVGVLGLGASFLLAGGAEGGLNRLWWSYLVNWLFFLSLSLGALGFVLIQHLTKAGWSVVLRRISEGLAASVIVLALLFIPLYFGLHDLYHWMDPDVVAHDQVIAHKAGYLNEGFFLARLAFYFLVWAGLGLFFLRASIKQDRTGEFRSTMRQEKVAAPGMLLFALTVTFASFDLLMSLDPHWFSTIFGVYFFAGGFLGFFALLPLWVVLLQGRGLMKATVTSEHYQDMGKLMFAFLVFWAYIAFSQFMLIWYGNLPEETGWYLRRQTGTWASLGLVMVFGHFLLPFLFLISKHVKRRPLLLALAGAWLLAMHWCDLYWLAMPEFDQHAAVIPWSELDLTCWVGMAGFFVATWAKLIGRASLVPERDPRLIESLSFENA